jgi:hypothetical protein
MLTSLSNPTLRDQSSDGLDVDQSASHSPLPAIAAELTIALGNNALVLDLAWITARAGTSININLNNRIAV